jgi:uncharacterized repeat protein (TIGR01451 family)
VRALSGTLLASLVVALSVVVAPAPMASAATQTVTNCNDTGGGSLRDAITNAAPGDNVAFALSPACSVITLASTLDITKNLTITGPGASVLAVSGNSAVQDFNVSAGVTASISGLTIEDGNAGGGCAFGCATSGGGIETAGTLTLTSMVVTDNGAGIGCIAFCGTAGGGIENDAGGILMIDHSTISGNNATGGCSGFCAGNGGGIENAGTLMVTDSTLSDNSANGGCVDDCGASGGGIDNNGGNATVDASTLSANQANNSCSTACGPAGGGIENDGGSVLTLHNSTVADNQANTGCLSNCGAFGGGVYNLGSATISNSTLSKNLVSGSCASACGNLGSDLYNGGTGTIVATIVANGQGATDCFMATALTDLGYNLDDDGSCSFQALTDYSNRQAGLDPAGLQSNGGPTLTIKLEPGSPAIEHVAAAFCPATDQRGFPRTPPCDIGAYDTDHANQHGSEVHAVIQVETSPSYADDTVHIESSQLQASCGGTIVFETLQGGDTVNPRWSTNSITVVLDNDGNVTVIVDGANCAPGTDLVEADLTVAPFLTATTILTVLPPQVTPAGLTATPNNEVETGDTSVSGDSDVYTIFYVETSPVYAEQPVEITSPQLQGRCLRGWRWEPGSGGTAINQTSGATKAVGILDDDGNAVFAFKGISCAAGSSAVIADVLAGTHPTYVTNYTIVAPQVTLPTAGAMATSDTTKKAKKAAHKHHRHHKGPKATPPGTAPLMTVDVSPNPLVETGVPAAPASSNVTITKTDDHGGSSITPSLGLEGGGGDIEYTITVSNTGAAAATNVLVSDPLTSNIDLGSDTYTSTATGGATGNTNPGTGDINDTLNLPPGSSVTYTVDTFVQCDAGPFIGNTATADSGGNTASATDADFVVPSPYCGTNL